MTAIIPTRFTSNINPASTWSEHMFRNWMHTAIPFSLGNFWWTSGQAGLDLNYALFPEFAIDDSRSPSSDTPTARAELCNGYNTAAAPILRANRYAGYSVVIR